MSNHTSGHHLGLGRAAVIPSRRVAAKQGFLMCYTKDNAIGTKVSVHYRESGRLPEVVIKKGFTVNIDIYIDIDIDRERERERESLWF